MSTEGWGSVQIKVTPEILVNKAEDVERGISRLKNCFQNMEQRVSATRNYWIGEAGEAHREMYQAQKENIDQILRRLSEHPVDLLQISGNYGDAERKIMESAMELPKEAIYTGGLDSNALG